MEWIEISDGMQMFFVFIYFIFAFGFTELLVFYDGPFGLLDKFRNLMAKFSKEAGKALECPICTSTWLGGFLSLLNYFVISVGFTPWNVIMGWTGMWYLIIPFDMITTAGVVLLLYHLDELVTKKSEEYEDE